MYWNVLEIAKQKIGIYWRIANNLGIYWIAKQKMENSDGYGDTPKKYGDRTSRSLHKVVPPSEIN
jgi:hypothetical protein